MAILNSWYGRNIGGNNQSSASQRTDQTYAQKGNILQPVFGPWQPPVSSAPQNQSIGQPRQATQKSATKTTATQSTGSAPVVTPPAPVVPTEPTLTKEQQLQIDADMMGLTGVERQAFIEEKRGILPRIRKTQKYADAKEAEASSGIATSTPVDAGAAEVAKDIETRLAETTGAISTGNAGNFETVTDEEYKKLYDLQQAGANKEYEAALQLIKDRFEQQREQTQQQRDVNVGRAARFLGRAGALSSAGGMSIANTEIAAAQEEMNRLATEEASMLTEAANAKNQNDLTRMESYLAKADELRAERNSIKEKNIDLQFQLEDRAQAQAASEAQYLGNLTLDQLEATDPAYVARVEKSLGMPTGYLKQIAETQSALAQAQSEEAQMELSMKLFDLAKTLPSGMSYTFADGTKIEGFDMPEGKVMEAVTATGDLAYVTIDPATGEVLNTVQIPGIISEIKAGAMYGRTSGRSGGGGGGGSGSAGNFDAQELALLQTMNEMTGRPNSEVANALGQIYASYGLEVPDEVSSLAQSQGTFNTSMGIAIGSALSDNISANVDDARDLLLEDRATSIQQLDDGTFAAINFNKMNPGAATYWAVQPTTTTAEAPKQSWWSRFWSGWGDESKATAQTFESDTTK